MQDYHIKAVFDEAFRVEHFTHRLWSLKVLLFEVRHAWALASIRCYLGCHLEDRLLFLILGILFLHHRLELCHSDLLQIWNVHILDILASVLRNQHLYVLAHLHGRDALKSVEHKVIKLRLSVVFEVHDWDNILFCDVFEHWHHLKHFVIYFLDVFLKE